MFTKSLNNPIILMKNAKYPSLYGQLIYVILTGLQLLVIPNVFLSIFGIETTNEVWIRVLGMLVLTLSFYYRAIAHHGNHEIVKATVWGRWFFCAGLIGLVIIGMAKPIFVGFALLEAGLAFWTWRELQSKA
jgi:hypothetical protein